VCKALTGYGKVKQALRNNVECGENCLAKDSYLDFIEKL